MQFKRTRFPSRFWRLPVPKRRDSSRDPSARPRPPGLDPRIRSWILLDPEQEREDEKERRERDEQVERPPRDRLLDPERGVGQEAVDAQVDRKSTRLNSSHSQISYAVFCLKKKKKNEQEEVSRT